MTHEKIEIIKSSSADMVLDWLRSLILNFNPAISSMPGVRITSIDMGTEFIEGSGVALIICLSDCKEYKIVVLEKK